MAAADPLAPGLLTSTDPLATSSQRGSCRPAHTRAAGTSRLARCQARSHQGRLAAANSLMSRPARWCCTEDTQK